MTTTAKRKRNPDDAKLRGRPWRVLRDRFRQRCAEAQMPCWICEQAIDYEANFKKSTSFEADHYRPVSSHPQLALSMGNLRPSHQACNRARGNNPAQSPWIPANW